MLRGLHAAAPFEEPQVADAQMYLFRHSETFGLPKCGTPFISACILTCQVTSRKQTASSKHPLRFAFGQRHQSFSAVHAYSHPRHSAHPLCVKRSRNADSTVYASLVCTPGWASSSRPTGCQPAHGCAQVRAQHSSHLIDDDTQNLGCQRLPRPGPDRPLQRQTRAGRGGAGPDYAAAKPAAAACQCAA